MATYVAPTSRRCPIGPLQAHTYGWEVVECIWCGPNGLAWKPGEWRQIEGEQPGTSAWHVDEKELEK